VIRASRKLRDLILRDLGNPEIARRGRTTIATVSAMKL
jgi:hypothetical protein